MTTIQTTVIDSLRTVFTPAAACTTPVFNVYSDADHVEYLPSFGYNYRYDRTRSGTVDGYTLVQVDLYSCYPSSTSIYTPVLFNIPTIIQPFYSPGLNCPLGYTAACSVTKNSTDQAITTGEGWEWSPAGRVLWTHLVSSNTAIYCCPSSWACAEDALDGNPQDLYRGSALIAKCTLPSSDGQLVTGLLPAENAATFITSYDGMASPTLEVTSVSVADGSVPILPAVVIVRRSTDPPYGTVESPSGRLSQTGKIIVAVVLPVAMIIIVTLVLKWIVTHRHRRQTQNLEQDASGVHEISYDPINQPKPPMSQMVQRKPVPTEVLQNFPSNNHIQPNPNSGMHAGTMYGADSSQSTGHNMSGSDAFQPFGDFNSQPYGRPTPGRP